MRARLHRWLQSQWQRKGWFSALLLPLSGLTRLALWLRASQTSWRAPVPVVVVGNILVGGTGKTPVVIALVRALRALGWQPAVVSRGYGVAVGPEPRLARGQADPAQVGDEPALIAHATGVPVAVHPRRVLAVQKLLDEAPETDLIIADDGLQHLALARDVEIVVQDARGIANGRLLPAGPLREPPARLTEVDVLITHVGADEAVNAAATQTAADTTDKTASTAANPRLLSMQLKPVAGVRVHDGLRLSLEALRQQLAGQSVAAAAGIGQPERFFAMLRRHGFTPSATLALPDHYAYRQSPFTKLVADAILLTTKDAIKCAPQAGGKVAAEAQAQTQTQAQPQTNAQADPRLWAIEVTAQFSDPNWVDGLDERLRNVAAELEGM